MSHSNSPCRSCPAHANSIFRLLSDRECILIDQNRIEQSHSDGKMVDLAGKVEPGAYCLKKGSWRLKRIDVVRNHTIRICSPSDFFGYSVFADETSPYIAQSLGASASCFFPAKEFQSLLALIPRLPIALLGHLTRTLAMKDHRICGLENVAVRDRLAAALLSLAGKFGIASERGIEIGAPIDREVLASLAGTTIETASRILTELEKDQVIRREKRRIVIENSEFLQVMAGMQTQILNNDLPKTGA